jgi:ABC-type multidrug transport system fused ATPase/permease subunit
LLLGTRYSVGLAVLVMGVIALTALPLSLPAAYRGGLAEKLLVLASDISMALPPAVLVLSIIGVLGQGAGNLIFAAVFSYWGWYARMVRSYVLMEKGKGYISLAVTGGSSTARILFRHILPNILPGLLVLFALGIGDVIMTISAFSFLGVALPSGTPEWGVMLNEARGVFLKSPRYAIYPGLCVFFTVCAFNLLGEGLRRRLSPFGKAADKALLSVRNLSITYRCDDTSISGVTFSIAKGKVLGLAGESGSGKSSVCKAILGLINPGLATVCGEIEFMGRDILPLSYEERRKINGKEIASTGPPCSLFPMICGYSRF